MSWLNWSEPSESDDVEPTDLTQVDPSSYQMTQDLTQPTEFDKKVDADTVAALNDPDARNNLQQGSWW